jgi:hypothetical protein
MTTTSAATLAAERPADVKIALEVALPRLFAELQRCEALRDRYEKAADESLRPLAATYEAEARGLKFALASLSGALLISGPDWLTEFAQYAGVTYP